MTTAQPTGIRRTPLIPLAELQVRGRAVSVPAATRHYREFADRFPAFVTDVRRADSDRKRSLDRLARRDRRAQRDLIRKLLHDRRSYLPYLLKALNRTGALANATPDSIMAMADRINPFAPCHEANRTKIVMHGSRERTVHSFGPIKRAQQRVVADVIRHTHPPRPQQFLFGGGVPAALRAVEAACARGLTHAVELDVEGFYGSIPKECLAGLLWPLPRAVVDHVVWDDTLRVAVDASPGVITVTRVTPPLNAAVGLSLGAASSPIVGEVLIGRLLADNAIDFGGDIITYADNLLVLGRSETEAMARAEHLAAVAETPDHGALRLRERERGHCLPLGTSAGGAFAQGIPFVGQLGQVIAPGRFSWEPSPIKQNEHRVAHHDVLPSLEAIEAAERKVAEFHRAFPLWQERDAREAEVRAELACARFYHNITSVDALSVAARSVVLALLLNGGERSAPELVPEAPPSIRQARLRLLGEVERLWLAIPVSADTDGLAA